MKKNQKGFSLIELSIVLVIIGILTVAIIEGASMIGSARISSARDFTSKSPVRDISGLIAWYETSLINSLNTSETKEGGNISKWYDTNPASVITKKNTLTKAPDSTVTYLIRGINNTPSLKFSGSGKISISDFFQGSFQQATVFFVIKPSIISGTLTLFDSDSSGSTSSISIKSNAINLNAGNSVDTATGIYPANFSNGMTYIVAVYLAQSYSKAYLNNAYNQAGNVNIDAGSNQIKGATIGSNKSGGNYFNGLISEVIIYNRMLPINERKDVMRYLSGKYKVQVFGL
jgi:prepilin-type N-terminal cleavage/methylation domain-containing protein